MDMHTTYDTPIQYIKGIGPRLGEYLGKKGLHTVSDLLEYFPRAYEDRRIARDIRSLKDGEIVSLQAKILKVSRIPLGPKRRIHDVLIADQSGQIHCKYFRIPFKGYFDKLEIGSLVQVVGKVTNYRGRIEFHHPDISAIETVSEDHDKLLPLYVETDGLTTRKFRRLITSALEGLRVSTQTFVDPLPEWIRKKYSLVEKFEALRHIHSPPQSAGMEYVEQRTPYHERIKFEELFWLELFLALHKTEFKQQTGITLKPCEELAAKLAASLPFELTGDQKNAIAEIRKDFLAPHPMHRLLQGDVGSGKTLVAFMTAAGVIENGYQVAMMAPTEILAEQHFKQAKRLFEPLGVEVALLTSRQNTKEKSEVLEGLRTGRVGFCIGTQALIQNKVEFARLAYVIVDEQHRFGVEQRQELKQKGIFPHLLLMTATPIPRSLALTVYGDLDVSIIKEKPKGRIEIQTRVTNQSKRAQILEFVQAQVGKGRQAYIIYPLIEESEKIDLKNAVEEYERLKTELVGMSLGLLHGRMKSEEKDAVMEEFRQGRTQVLVSTTVIEVGVDVPNATLMIIENAERFGLSQLHQLRGRVGRGEHKSFCVLVLGYAVSQESRDRVQWLEKTSDGFRLAEADLQIRGPGEFMGTRQAGALGFKMADLVRDYEILKRAREAAFELVAMDASLSRPEHAELKKAISEQKRFRLFGVG